MESKFEQGDKVRIDCLLSYKRNGQVARVKWNPSNKTYVTVVFADGCSGKYRREHLTKIK